MPTYQIKTKTGSKTVSYNAFQGSLGTRASGSTGSFVGVGINLPSVPLNPGSPQEQEAQAESIVATQKRLNEQIAEGKAPENALVTDFLSPHGGETTATDRYRQEDVKRYASALRQANTEAGIVREPRTEITGSQAIRGLRSGALQAYNILNISPQARKVEEQGAGSMLFTGKGLLENLTYSQRSANKQLEPSSSILPAATGEVHAVSKPADWRGKIDTWFEGMTSKARTKSELTGSTFDSFQLFGLSAAKGASSVAIHPWQTTKGAIGTLINPPKALRILGESLKINPVGTAGELTGQLLTMRAVGAGIGKGSSLAVSKLRGPVIEPAAVFGKTTTASLAKGKNLKVVAATAGKATYKDSFGFLKNIDYKGTAAVKRFRERIAADATVDIKLERSRMFESVKVKDAFIRPSATFKGPQAKNVLQEALQSNPAPLLPVNTKLKEVGLDAEAKALSKMNSAFESGLDNPISKGRAYPDRISGLFGQKKKMPGRLPERNPELELIQVETEKSPILTAENMLRKSIEDISSKELRSFIQRSNQAQLLKFEQNIRSGTGSFISLGKSFLAKQIPQSIQGTNLLSKPGTLSFQLPELSQNITQSQGLTISLKGLQSYRLKQQTLQLSRQIQKQNSLSRQLQRQQQSLKQIGLLELRQLNFPKELSSFKLLLSKPKKPKHTSSVAGSKFIPLYFPSLEAEVFKIKATRPSSSSVATGLELRPILFRKKKKKY